MTTAFVQSSTPTPTLPHRGGGSSFGMPAAVSLPPFWGKVRMGGGVMLQINLSQNPVPSEV